MTKAEELERETNLRKIDAEISKLIAETAQLNVETSYYVLFRGVALAVALLGAGAAASKIFL